MKDREFFLVVGGVPKAPSVVEIRWKELVQGFRTSLERMKEQPKYPQQEADDPE